MMPRYFFSTFDTGSFEDDVGSEFADDDAARLEAMRTLPEIAKDRMSDAGDKQGYMIMVTDQGGAPVYSATISFFGVRMR